MSHRFRPRSLTLAASTLSALMLLGGAVAGQGGTERISVSSSRAQANSASGYPAISSDSGLSAFASYASNLVAGDTNYTMDIFTYELSTFETKRVSVSSSGGQANAASYYPDVSADGRYIAFQSDATNLVPGDTNGKPDIFVRDRIAGTTIRASVASDGTQGNNRSELPAISADGRYVAFQSGSTNLVLGDTNSRYDIFVRDIQTGQTIIASLTSTGTFADGSSVMPDISGDGNVVVFESYATNHAPGDTNGATADVYLRDISAGITQRVSVGAGGVGSNGQSFRPSVSSDGNLIAFDSDATNLISGDTNSRGDVFVLDRTNASMKRVSIKGSSQGDGFSSNASLSGNGRYLTFESSSTNLVTGDTNTCTWYSNRGECPDVFLADLQDGTLIRVSVATWGGQGNGRSGDASPTSDGRFVIFTSDASNLTGDSNGASDVFLWDRRGCHTDQTEAGSLSKPMHDTVEPALGSSSQNLHYINCDVIAPEGY